MNIKKYILTFIAITQLCSLQVLAQSIADVSQQNTHIAEYWELKDPETGDHVYQARKYVKLEPGFTYSAVGNNSEQFKGEINPYLVFPPSSGITGGPNNNDDGVVGATLGSYAVTPSGAATYNIPIIIPEGTAGLQPNISINYNSQSSDGYLGIGWNIGGQSVITRGRTDLYHEGYIDPVDYDDNDVFYLDGQRLVEVENTGVTPPPPPTREKVSPEEATAEYRTAIESFTKIQTFGTTGNGPEKFKVWKKNGLIYEYGYNANSKLMSADNSNVHMWLLYRVYDRNDNFYEYHYGHTDFPNSSYIDYFTEYIEYTGNEKLGLTPYFKIQFNYEERQSSNLVHFNNQIRCVVAHQLTSIEVKKNSSILKSYNLIYEEPESNEKRKNLRLIEVKEKGLNSTTLNSTKIQWNEYKDELFTEYSPDIYYGSNNLYDIITGDFTGDGKTDVAACRYYMNQSAKIYTGCEVFESTGHNTYISRWSMTDVNSNTILFKSGDFNGDGKADILRVDSYGYGNNNYDIKLYMNNQHNCDLDDHTKTWNYSNNGKAISSFLVYDLNGDKIDDIVYMEVNSSNTKNAIGNIIELDNDIYDPQINAKNIFTNMSVKNINVGDFNGDGIQDLMLVSGIAYLYTYSGIDDSFRAYDLNMTIDNNMQLYTGDFNGDGNSDVLIFDPDDNSISIQQSNGVSLDQSLEFFVDYYPSGSNLAIKIADVNGDGKSELLCLTSEFESGVEKTKIKCYYFDRNFCEFRQDFYDRHHEIGADMVHVGDFNGDGNQDLFINKRSGYSSMMVGRSILFHENEKSKFIKSITNGVGCKTEFEFEPITNNDIYEKEISAFATNFGHFRDFQGPVFVATSIIEKNASSNYVYSNNKYNYKAARICNQGVGFIGFGEIVHKNTTQNRKVIDKYDYKFPDPNNPNDPTDFIYFSVLKEKEVKINTSGITLSHAEYSNSLAPLGENRILLLQDQEITKTYHSDGTLINIKKTDYKYNEANEDPDEYGNIDQIDIRIHGSLPSNVQHNSSYDFHTQQKFLYKEPDAENWLIGLRSSETMVYNYNNESKTKKKSYTYYPNGQLWRINNEPNSSLTQSIINEYNDYGHITKITKTGDAVLTDKVIEFSNFEATQRYAEKKTTYGDDRNYVEQYTYNDWGKIRTMTDPNGLTTANEYDDFNRLIKSISPDGVETHSAIRWIESCDHDANLTTPMYYTWESSSGSSPIIKIYNCANQKLREVLLGYEEGQFLYTDYNYDSKGRLSSVSLPYFSTNSELAKTYYSYDSKNRLKNVTAPKASGQYITTTVDYNAKDIIYTDAAGNTSKRILNAIGQVVSVTDANNQMLNYKYFADGQLEYIEDPDGNKTSFTYDALGNRKTIEDPDYGKVETEYNAFGELVKKIKYDRTDGITVLHTENYEYDRVGRMTKSYFGDEANPENLTTYSYDQAANGIGLLDEVSIDYKDYHGNITNTKETFSYDQLSRLSSYSKSIGTETFDIDYTYDSFSNVKSMKYPNEYMITNHYNFNGYLTKIYDNKEHTIWQCNAINEMGMIEDYLIGGVVNRIEQFNDYTGHLEALKAKKTSSSVYELQDMAFQWWDRGYLKSREYKNKGNGGILEEFTYDNRNRLDIFKRDSQVIEDYEYYDNGNLKIKPTTGEYAYDGSNNAGPHAISGITIPAGGTLIDDTPQNIYYTDFDKVSYIEQETETPNIDKTLDFIYGTGHEKVKQIYDDGNGYQETKIYVNGLFEKSTDSDGNEIEYNYVFSPSGLVAVYSKDGDNEGINYMISDHLGSLNVITDENGNKVEELNFDPWGWHRDPETLATLNSDPSSMFNIGFTGHEHLNEFGIIDMKGRLYDPGVARFMSPDNYVADTYDYQAFNRYSYCFNNPLSYIDPDGENPMAIIAIGAAVLGGAANVASMWGEIDNLGEGAMAFGAGAISGLLAVEGGLVGAALGGAATATVNSMITQMDDWSEFKDIDWEQAAGEAMIGGIGGFFAGVGAHLGSVFSAQLIKNLGIQNAYINSIIRGAIDGAASETVGVMGATYVATGDLDKSWEAARKSTLNGAITGSAFNVAGTFAQKKGLIRDEWFGKTKQKTTGHSRKRWEDMTDYERERFKHSYGSGGPNGKAKQLGLPNFKESNAQYYLDLFNERVTSIRSAGWKNFYKTKELYYGKYIDVYRTDPIINGQQYYFYETLDGTFISAGKF